MFARFIFIHCLLALFVVSSKGQNDNCCDSLLTEIVYIPSRGEGVVIDRDISLLSDDTICSISVSGVDDAECRGEIIDGGDGQNYVAVKIYSEPGAPLKCRVDVNGYCKTTPIQD